MKALVFVLVLGNLLFYAFSAGLFGRAENPDAGRVDQQVKPERLRIVSRGEPPAAPPKPAPTALAESLPVAPNEPSDTLACLVWPRLPVVDAERLGRLLAERFPAYRVRQQEIAGEGSGWWVYIPPLPDKPAADRKMAELRALGVADFFSIPEGPLRFAISLGVFSSEKAAQDHLAALKAKGVRSAKAASRPGRESALRIEATGPATTLDDLRAAAAGSVPGHDPQACP